jgi:hypothetical protein
MFDRVYVVANGSCIYQGGGQHIVSYAATLGLCCPTSHNPADFSESRAFQTRNIA